MHQNVLLRSGRGLGTSGTARKKTPAVVAPVPAEEKAGHFVVRNGVKCAGAHLIIDLYGASRLDDIEYIEATLRRCVTAAKATLLHIHLHHFQPNGVSGVAVLAESHISIHSWPEAGYAALDVFMCGSCDPHATVDVLKAAFKPNKTVVKEHLRAGSLEERSWIMAAPKKVPVRVAKARRAA